MHDKLLISLNFFGLNADDASVLLSFLVYSYVNLYKKYHKKCLNH
jgi:hypothetical protein